MAETRHHENVEVEEIVEAALRDVKSTSQLKAFLQKLQETMKEEAKSDYKAIIELQKLRDDFRLPKRDVNITKLLISQESLSDQPHVENFVSYKDLVILLKQQTQKAVQYVKRIKKERIDIIRAILMDMQLAIEKSITSPEQAEKIKEILNKYESYL